MRPRSEDLSPAELRLLDDVEEQGVHVVHVPAAGEQPGHSYSVGLWESFGQPEVLVFGLPEDIALDLINVVADEADQGTQFAAGTRHAGLLQDYPVSLLDVPKALHGAFLQKACWAYEGEEFPVVQLVWPDKQGRWPWEDGVRAGFRDAQPVLAMRPPLA